MGLRTNPFGNSQLQHAAKAIIEAERQPVRSLEARKTREEARLKLFQEFKSKFAGIDKSLSELNNFKKFRELKVDLGSGENLVSVTVDKERAEPGEYEIQIDQIARRSSALSNGFKDPNEPVIGMGFVVLENAHGSFEIFLEESEASLNGLANKINQEKGFPVRASVIRDAYEPDRPWKMILTAKQDGLDDEVIFPQFYFMDGIEDFYLDEDREAQNSRLVLDGFPIDTDSNKISDFLPGMNMHLKQSRPDEPFILTISEDLQKISGKMKDLVDKVNGILEFIYKQNAIDASTDTKTTFAGDSGLQSIEFRMRNVLHEGYPVWDEKEEDFRIIHLNKIGVTFERNGMLAFKEDKFQKALESDFAGVAESVTGEQGFANRLGEALRMYTRPYDGMLTIREQGLRSRIRQLDTNISDKERILARRAQSLTDQFGRLEANLQAMQRQQQYLAASMGGGGGGGDILSQLMGR